METVKNIFANIVAYPISAVISKTYIHNFNEKTIGALVGISFIAITLSFYK